jgi:hypothetical protein
MHNPERGITAVGALVGVVVLAVLVLGGLYAFSDVFRTKAKSTYRDFAEWTPENIAEDPINYLNFAEEQTKKALKKLKASEISIAQKRSKLEQMEADADRKIRAGNQALVELKGVYNAAEAAGAWPADWKEQPRTRDWVRKQIVGIHGQVQGQEKLVGKVRSGLKQLEVQQGRVVEQRGQCQIQLTEIATNREMLKVQEITDDLTEQLVSMKGLLTTIATTSEDEGVIQLDDLAAEAEASVDDTKFDAIMAE